MNRITRLFGSSAVAALSLAAPAGADVTPQQVWDDLESYLRSFGYEVEASESLDGEVLTISGFALRMEMPEDEGTFSFAADSIVLTDQGDGTVAVAFPETMPIRMQTTGSDGEAVDLTVDYTQTGLEMLVSGAPADLDYVYSAETLGLVLSRLTVDGVEMQRDAARMDVTMADVSGRATVAVGEMRDIAQTLAVGRVSYELAFSDPDSSSAAEVAGNMSDLTFDGTTTLPLDPAAGGDGAAGIPPGMQGRGVIDYRDGTLRFAATEEDQTTTGETSTETARLSVSVSPESVSYETRTTGLDLTVVPPDMPFPVSVQMAESSVDVTVPVAASDTPQELSLGMTLRGFTMSDMLWNIFDSGNVLPRDPATVSLDLLATVTPFVNLFDAEAVSMLEETGGVPGELNTVTLKDLTVDAAGAKLTGTGEFTFDNSDMETYAGMPAPDGVLRLNLAGGNALIDRLIEMGVLAEQDAMGARMMMSMFTVPGEGEDTLRSTIEVKGNGQILANGQRIK